MSLLNVNSNYALKYNGQVLRDDKEKLKASILNFLLKRPNKFHPISGPLETLLDPILQS
jgi:hypothetical protein